MHFFENTKALVFLEQYNCLAKYLGLVTGSPKMYPFSADEKNLDSYQDLLYTQTPRPHNKYTIQNKT